MTDVLIAGGGIAGSSLALLLSRRGLEVELYERSGFPREKACGEGLMPAGVAALERLGVPICGAPFRGVRFRFGREIAAGSFRAADGNPSRGLGVRRWHLDTALFNAAADAGVRAKSGIRVEGPLIENGRIAGVCMEGEARRARLVVAADGVHSVFRHKLGLDVPPRRKRAGIRAHFRLAPGQPRPEWVDVYLGNGHELYVTPLPDGELLVAALGTFECFQKSAKAFFRRAIAAQRPLAELLDGAAQLDEAAGASPLTVRARVRVLPGLVLLGDAAGCADPITGGGMTQALLSAELLAAHLEHSFPADLEALNRFDGECQRMLRNYRTLTNTVLWLSRHQALARSAFRALRAWPALFSRLLGVAGGNHI